jgi:hypothetical protein
MEDVSRPTADALNAHLASGGIVQVTTYLRSTIYSRKHAGWFSEHEGSLHVRHGRTCNRLSTGERLLVSVRTGRYV